MSVLTRLKRAYAALRDAAPHLLPQNEGALGTNPDTLAAISELTRVFSADPKAVELSLALGNLLRSQGDIERAVKLRERLLSSDNLDTATRGKILFELACDYRRAGLLDRAERTYKETRALDVSPDRISLELAQLYADSGNFSAAAQEYATLQNPLAEAHFLVKQAEEAAAQSNDAAAHRLVKKATAVYPPSPEAWLALTSMSLLGGNTQLTAQHLTQGLEHTLPSGRLLLLEGLYALTKGSGGPDISPAALQTLVSTLTSALKERPPELLQYYYGGLFLQQAGRFDEAEAWYTKALVLAPDFWATRLNLMELSAQKDPLPPLLAAHIFFFTSHGSDIKRFCCTHCSLRRDQIFYHCPRCHTWHSVNFRFSLQ